MRCHIAPLVWADRCLPLSSTGERIDVESGEMNRRKTQIVKLHIGVLSTLLLSLEVVVDAENFNWTTTSLV